ncbi:hypothetical protein Pmani_032953 [Petrolisthes manimaculis]|uniref:Uncharacterized protein n=1 Tax=Petrolisthes manimaculis TaxID=1843537 RepID=A0AAE1NRJ1_9EUCA|nr:hypothetical protein Pmani_032953 [Petrolisthes manimaculis]
MITNLMMIEGEVRGGGVMWKKEEKKEKEEEEERWMGSKIEGDEYEGMRGKIKTVLEEGRNRRKGER